MTESAMERAPWERPAPVRHEGMNGTGIRQGEKIMADYSVRLDGEEFLRTVVMRVRSAWPLQGGLTYVSALEGAENGSGRIYAVRTETIRVIA